MSRVTAMSVNGNVVFGAVLFRILRFRAKATRQQRRLELNFDKSRKKRSAICDRHKFPITECRPKVFSGISNFSFFLLFIISLPSLLAARKKEKLSCADHRQVSQESTQKMIAHNGRKKNVCDGDKRGGISWSSSISGYLRALSTYRNLTVCALVR